MSGPFRIGSVHSGWKVTTAVQAGAAPRYVVTREGEGEPEEGVLTHYPFEGRRAALHQALATRLEGVEGLTHEALLPVAYGRVAKGIYVVQPSTERLGEGKLGVPEALTAVERVAQALGEIHRQDQLHGELDAWCLVKRGGVFVVQPPGLRLTPPGVKRLGLEVDPRYAAPEILDGRPADARSDLFSLGLVLYRLLTGKPPAEASDPSEVFAARGQQQVPHPDSDWPEAVRALYRKMTALSPRQRPQDAQELLADLKATQAGTSPKLHAAPPVPAIKPTSAGVPLAIFGVLLLVLALIGGYSFGVLGAGEPLAGYTYKLPTESPKTDAAKTGSDKTGSAKTGSAKTGSAKTDSAKSGSAKTGSAKTGAKTGSAKTD